MSQTPLLSFPSRCPPSMSTECCSARRRSWPRWSPRCRTAGSLSRSACAPAESPAPDCSGLWVGLTLLLTLQSWPLAWPLGPDLSPAICTPKISLGLPDCISLLDLLTLSWTDSLILMILYCTSKYIKTSCQCRRSASRSSVSLTFILIWRVQNPDRVHILRWYWYQVQPGIVTGCSDGLC